MGERAGYRVRQGKLVSPLLRKQWFIGDGEKELKKLVMSVAEKLMSTPYSDEEPKIGSGFVALREDLDIGRLVAALYSVLYKPPFDSIEFSTNCDISDHGIYEIELVRWNLWTVNHYSVRWDSKNDTEHVGRKKVLFCVKFIPGQTLKNGVQWLSYDDAIVELIADELIVKA
jgi:hypothetical protein